MFRLSHRPAAIASSSIERHTPDHSNQPAFETLRVAQLQKFLMRLRERLLRDVLGVFAMPQHRKRDPEG